MSNSNLKDVLRLAVESASGGKQTVRYTKKGQPCFFTVIDQVSLQTLSPEFSEAANELGPHPAFKKGETYAKKLLVATYASAMINGELVSQPNRTADWSNSLGATIGLITQQGENWNVINSLQYSLLKSISYSADHFVEGNTSKLGWSKFRPELRGRRSDGKHPTEITVESGWNDFTQVSQILGGSGPVQFRHDNTYTGVSDLVNGIGWTACIGTRVVGTEVQVYDGPNHEGMSSLTMARLKDLRTSTESGWWAIDATTGNLIPTSATGTLVDSSYSATTPNSVRITDYGTVATNAINIAGNFAVIGGEPNWYSALNPKVTARLALYALYPEIFEKKHLAGGEFYLPPANTTKSNIWFLVFGRENIYQAFYSLDDNYVTSEYFNQCFNRITILE